MSVSIKKKKKGTSHQGMKEVLTEESPDTQWSSSDGESSSHQMRLLPEIVYWHWHQFPTSFLILQGGELQTTFSSLLDRSSFLAYFRFIQ